MTRRKPTNMSVATWVERQINDATDDGAFDDLRGAGKPLPNIGRSHDDLAWVADYLKRENIEVDALLPPALALAKEVEQLPVRLLREPSEDRARAVAEDLNARILRALAAPQVGPPLRVGQVDVEAVLARRRSDLAELAAGAAPQQPAPQSRTAGTQRSSKRRLLCRRRTHRGRTNTA